MQTKYKRFWSAALAAVMVLSVFGACSKDSGDKKGAVSGSDSTPSHVDTSYFEEGLAVGDHVTFGRYEQDGDADNGAEEIEWRVLAVKDDKALLLTEYLLDCQKYNETAWANVTWEKCTLRKWLNADFYNTAFSESEQTVIVETSFDGYKDKLFLLDKNDAKTYFPSDKKERIGYPTKYAVQQGAVENENGAGLWWLSSSTHAGYRADIISRGGGINEFGSRTHDDWIGVRPAMWVKL